MATKAINQNTVEIPLTKGYTAVVDAVDGDLAAHRWHCIKNGYARRRDNYKYVFMHRLILERMLGRQLRSNEMVDHINMNVCDNRRCNLRVCTKSQNMRNRGKPSNNTSGYKGVSYSNRHRKWQAVIGVHMKAKHLGVFDTPEEAYDAYCQAAIELHGPFARFE